MGSLYSNSNAVRHGQIMINVLQWILYHAHQHDKIVHKHSTCNCTLLKFSIKAKVF